MIDELSRRRDDKVLAGARRLIPSPAAFAAAADLLDLAQSASAPVLPDPEYLRLAGAFAMALGCRPARKFAVHGGDRAAFHPPRSCAGLKLIEKENPK